MNLKIYLETFGCSYNQASSEILQGILLDNKYPLVDNIQDCDLIILNTCIVKTNTEAHILHLIKTYSKNYQNKGLIITGCMPEVLSEKILEINPKISMVGPHYTTEILKAVSAIAENKSFIQIGKRKESKLCLPRKIQDPIIGKIQIAQGCRNNCAYCITKHAMGSLYSYPKNDILQEIQIALNKGCKEIWLTAQDTGCYGLDSDSSLSELLNEIIQIPSDFKIRVGMMNPTSFKEIFNELVKIYQNNKIYNFIHIPIQSGNNEILKLMNRQYSISEIQDLILKFRTAFPDLALSIDIIVGFPSETDDQFNDTISIVKNIQPDIVNISKFGARPKTLAADMKPLPSKIVKRRSTVLSQICDEIARSQNQIYFKNHPKLRALSITYGKKGGVIARTDNYKPVIIENAHELGRFYEIKLVGAFKNYLKGITVSKTEPFSRAQVL